MSPDDLYEMEQLDSLATELAAAGRMARVAIAAREVPQPVFAATLRASLLSELPERRTADGVALAFDAGLTVPLPPVRPLDAPERLQDRRHALRPFSGTNPASAALTPHPDDVETIYATSPTEMDLTRAGRRWAATAIEAPAPTAMLEADGESHIAALKPSMRWHIPTRVLPSRWLAVGLAASVAIASLVYGTTLLVPARTVSTASQADAATLVRGDVSNALVAGTQLHEGDEIRVAAAGSATLQLGDSYVRMAGGADLQIKSLDPSHLNVDQITGRVYHRVTVPAGSDYQVETATVTWRATGTAFDLDRTFTSGGGEQVLGLALYDGLGVRGPGVQDSLAEGMSATIVLRPDGTLAGSPVIEPISAQAMSSPWLLANANLDAVLGLPLGHLAVLLSPNPTATPTAEPTVTPTPTPTPTEQPTAEPTPEPTPVPKPAPTARPTAQPTTTGPANLGSLAIVHNGNGTYTFSWPKYHGSWSDGSQYYKLMYVDYPGTPNYGTSGDYWVCNTAAADNSWTDTIPAGNYNVRLQVVDESSGNTVIKAQTNVVHLVAGPSPTLTPTQDLGPLGVHDNGDGTFTFSWTAYTGGPFSWYKLVYETTASGKDPSYPGGSPIWAVPGTGDTSSVPIPIGAGDYKVRIQAIGYPGGSAYAYAQTTVLHLVVP